MASFNDRLKEERLRKSLTQTELANYLNVTKQTVSNWENGNREPDISTLANISNFFDCSVDFLVGKSNLRKDNNIFTNPNKFNDPINYDKITSLKDDLIDLLIKRGIIKNKNDLNEEHLQLIEMAIKTYKDNKKTDD